MSADLQKHASFDAPGKKYIGSTYVTLNHLQMKKNKTEFEKNLLNYSKQAMGLNSKNCAVSLGIPDRS